MSQQTAYTFGWDDVHPASWDTANNALTCKAVCRSEILPCTEQYCSSKMGFELWAKMCEIDQSALAKKATSGISTIKVGNDSFILLKHNVITEVRKDIVLR